MDSETQQVTAGSGSEFKALDNAIIEIISAAAKISAEREFITNLPALVVAIITSIPASRDVREFKKNFSSLIDAIASAPN